GDGALPGGAHHQRPAQDAAIQCRGVQWPGRLAEHDVRHAPAGEDRGEKRGEAMTTRRKPRLLDLFCGAGGCSVGYARAGFEVVGVDLAPQKHYPFEFHQADALTFPLEDFDVIHASPPCQGYSPSKGLARTAMHSWRPLLGPMRDRLEAWGGVWVMENVAGSHSAMRWPLRLCGTQFGLRVYRHRLFETSIALFSPGQCQHPRYLEPDY